MELIRKGGIRMSEKILNRPILERIAKEIMNLEESEQVEAFVNLFVYTMLLD